MLSKLRTIREVHFGRANFSKMGAFTDFRRLVLGCMDSYDSERERDRDKIFRNPLTATCDDGTFRPASELENRGK